MNTDDKQQQLTLGILQTIAKQPDISQRSIAKRFNVALGVANATIKRCLRKGLLKIEQAPPNRYLYYLTPQGFSEKAHLATNYLKRSLHFYRFASDSYASVMQHCRDNGWHELVFVGVSDLVEIALFWARQSEFDVLGIYDPEYAKNEHLNLTVWSKPADCPAQPVYILTSAERHLQWCEQLLTVTTKERILAPDIYEVAVS